MYLGDFAEDADIFFKFTTRAFATGVPTVLTGSPVLSVYKDEGGAATEKTTSESYFDLDVDHDSIAGWNNVRLDLSGDAFFATGADYSIVITTGTVGGTNVFGENIANFSIENRSMGQPAGATLAADIAALKAETVLILADTDDIGVAGAGLTALPISDANLTQMGGVAQSATDLKDFADAGYNPATNKVTGVLLTDTTTAVTNTLDVNIASSDNIALTAQQKLDVNTEADSAIVTYALDHLVQTSVTGTDVADNSIIAKLVDDAGTADWDGYDPATASLEALNVDTDAIITDIGNLNDISTANVNTEVDNSMVTYHLDHLMHTAVADEVVDNTVIAHIMSKTGDFSTFDDADDSLEAIRDHATTIKSETALIVADTDVIDDGTSGLVKIASDVAAVLADTGTDGVKVGSFTSGAIDAAAIAADAIGSSELAATAATEIANAVWDTDATGRQTAGTFGQAIGDPAANAETMYEAVVTDATGTNVAADIIAIKSQTVAIEADTDVIDDGTSGLVKIASDVAANKVVVDKFAFTVANQVDANTLAISGSTDAADKLEASAEVLITGLAETGTLSTTNMTSDLAEATNDHYIGRTVIWTSGVLLGQASDITDYIATDGQLVYTATTEAPSNGDSFVIV